MKRTSVLPLLFAIALPLSVRAELNIETIGDVHPASNQNGEEEMAYRFPRISGDSDAAVRINTYLHAVELNKLPGRFSKSPFEEIWPGMEPPYHGTTGTGFAINANTPGFLSLNFYYSYMAAYPSGGSRGYNFDARTGQPIDLELLFTAQGLTQFQREIIRARLQRLDDFVGGKEIDEYGTKLSDDPDIAVEQKGLYSNCFASVASDGLADNVLALHDDELKLRRHACGGRAEMAIDELGDFDNAFTYRTLEPWLTGYGKCLLIERRTDCVRASGAIDAGVYRGKIAEQYPITLVMETNDSKRGISAAYFYDRWATRIPLSASKSLDGTVILDEPGTPPARFALKRAGSAVEGTWTQAGKPPVRVELR